MSPLAPRPRPVVRRAALFAALIVVLLPAHSKAAAEEKNELLEGHRARIRSAVGWLASPDAEVRRKGLDAATSAMLWKGASMYPLLEPAEEQVMAPRAMAQAISELAGATAGAAEPVKAPSSAVRALQALAGHSDVTQQAYADRLMEVVALLVRLDVYSKKRLFDGFRMLGRRAEPAVPTLGAMLKEPDVGLAAAITLGQIGGEQARELLRTAVEDESDEVREFACRGWMHFSTAVSLADVRAVAAGLHDASPRVREGATRAFMNQHWQVRASGLEAAALSEVAARAPLDSPDEKVRRAACILLGLLGEHGRSRAVDLARLLTADPNKYAREEAAAALARVDPAKATVERLVDALARDKDASVRLVISKAILSLAAHAGSVRDRLLAEIRRANERGDHALAQSLMYTLSKVPTGASR
jgi:hypothetical protein